ncbi:MAG: V-type ATP synthase subunit F [Oscillospiraceae bacterium]|nr:V-type ATP synthase subunit F [Oscillospiraceae bacterium]
MALEYKIGVIGDLITVNGFKALGLDAYSCVTVDNARRALKTMVQENYAIVYITEQLAQQMPADIARYKDSVTPAVILIPSSEGSLGLGQTALREAVERAVGGSDIV